MPFELIMKLNLDKDHERKPIPKRIVEIKTVMSIGDLMTLTLRYRTNKATSISDV